MDCCIRRIELISTHEKLYLGRLDGERTFAGGIFSGTFDGAE